MDPATSARFAMDFEQSWGTAKAIPTAHQIAFVSESLTGTQQLIDNPSIRGDFNPVSPVYGKKTAGGALVHIPTLKTAPFFQKWLTGTLAESGAGPDYVLTSKLGKTIPPGVVAETEIDINGTKRYMRGEGLRLNRLGIQFASDGFLQLNCDVLGRNVAIHTSSLDAIPDDWTAEDPIDHMQIATADITSAVSPRPPFSREASTSPRISSPTTIGWVASGHAGPSCLGSMRSQVRFASSWNRPRCSRPSTPEGPARSSSNGPRPRLATSRSVSRRSTSTGCSPPFRAPAL